MDGFLQGLAQSGRLDSVGEFTVDSNRALSLLARFRDQEKFSFARFAVSSAILAGAQKVRYERGFGTLRLADQGEVLQPHEAEELFTHLISRRNLRLHYLARALYHLTGLPVRDVTFCSGGLRLCWEGRKFESQPLRPALKGNLLSFRADWKQFLGFAELMLSTREELLVRGRFLGARLQGIGRRKGASVLIPGNSPAAVLLTHEGFQVTADGKVAQKPSPGNFSAVLWLKPEPSRMCELALLEGGVEVQLLEEHLGYPGWQAVIECPSLEKDLDGRVVMNDAYQRFLEALRGEALDLLEQLPAPERLRPPWLGLSYSPRQGPYPREPSPFLPRCEQVQFSSNGRYALTPSDDHLLLWDLASQQVQLQLPPHPKAAHLAEFCAGTTLVVVVDPESRRWVDGFDCRTGFPTASYQHDQTITSIRTSKDGMSLYIMDSGESLWELDTATGKRRPLHQGRSYEPQHVEGLDSLPSPDGRLQCVQHLGGSLLIDLQRRKPIPFKRPGRWVREWSPDGQSLLVQSGRQFQVLLANGSQVGLPFVSGFLTLSVQLGPTPGSLVVREGTTEGTRVVLYRWETGSQAWQAVSSQTTSCSSYSHGCLAWLAGQTLMMGDWERAEPIDVSLHPARIGFDARGRWLQLQSADQCLEMFSVLDARRKFLLGEALAEGTSWQAFGDCSQLLCSNQGRMWRWDFSQSESFQVLPWGTGWAPLQAGREYLVASAGKDRQVVLGSRGERLWEADQILLLGDGLALRSGHQVVEVLSQQVVCQLPEEGRWLWLGSQFCARLLPSHTEVWDCRRGLMLCGYSCQAYNSDEIHQDDLLRSAMLPFIYQGKRLSAHQAESNWSVRLQVSSAGFHVLTSQNQEGRASALALPGPYSRDLDLAFSSAGRALAVQIGLSLHLVSIELSTGRLRLENSRMLTVESWRWAGEVLLLLGHAYLELCDRRGQLRRRIYLLAEGYVTVEPGSTEILRQQPLADLWRELQDSPVAADPLPPGEDGLLLGGLQTDSPVELSAWEPLDFCPGCQDVARFQNFGVIGSCDHLTVWDLRQERMLWAIPPAGQWQLCERFGCLALVREAKLIFLDLASGRLRASYRHPEPIRAFSLNSQAAVVGEADGSLTLVDLQSGEARPLTDPEWPFFDRLESLTHCPLGAHLAVQGACGVQIYSPAGGYRAQYLPGRRFLSWSQNGDHFQTLYRSTLEERSVLKDQIFREQYLTLLSDPMQVASDAYRLYQLIYQPVTGEGQLRAHGYSSCGSEEWMAPADHFVLPETQQLAWTRGVELRRSRLPIRTCATVKLSDRCRRLVKCSQDLATISMRDKVEWWLGPELSAGGRAGRALCPGGKSLLLGCSEGLAWRTESELLLWRPQGGWLRLPHMAPTQSLQLVPGLISHPLDRYRYQVLDWQGKPLWQASEIYLCSHNLAITRNLSGEMSLVDAASGEPTSASGPFEVDPPARPYGFLRDLSDRLELTPDLQIAKPAALHPSWQFLVFAMSVEGGQEIHSLDLHSGDLRAGGRVREDARQILFNSEGTQVALGFSGGLDLYAFSEGKLDHLSRLDELPGCQWGWAGQALVRWCGNFVELAGATRLYLTPKEVVEVGPKSLAQLWAELY